MAETKPSFMDCNTCLFDDDSDEGSVICGTCSNYSGWKRKRTNSNPINLNHLECAFENILDAFGLVGRPGMEETPARAAKALKEMLAGYNQDPKDILKIFPAEKHDEMIICDNITLHSMCEHHMLPFIGVAHVAYIPKKENGIVGLSKLARLVDCFAKRLQVQERITTQVTKALMEHLDPMGAACIIEAKHMCMCMRGVKKQGSSMITSSMEGVFREKPEVRQEFLALIGK